MLQLDELDFVGQFPTRNGNWHVSLYILKDNNHNEYICAVAKNKQQERTLRNECLCHPKLEEFYDHGFSINPLIQHGELSPGNRFRGSYYALYPYLKGTSTLADIRHDVRPLQWIQQSYQNHAVEKKMTQELAEEITHQFLAHRYGEDTARAISEIEPVLELKNAIAELDTVKLCPEQGDLKPPNLLKQENRTYLIDFGLAALNQPIGHDLYLYNQKLRYDQLDPADIPYYNINACKYRIKYYSRSNKNKPTKMARVALKSGTVIETPVGDINFRYNRKKVELDLTDYNLEQGDFVDVINKLQKKYKCDLVMTNAKDYYYGLDEIDDKRLLFSGVISYPRYLLLKRIVLMLIPIKLWRRKFRSRYIKNKS